MIDENAATQFAALRNGEISPRELMSETLDRIAAVNPAINAIVALRDRDVLLDEAEAAPMGPLQGLPIAIKDLEDTKGLRTTYGSPIFKNHVPSSDSAMVARLRNAGAVIIGTMNTPEFGLGSHSYNPIYGVTRNPYDQSKSAGGSSGGASDMFLSQLSTNGPMARCVDDLELLLGVQSAHDSVHPHSCGPYRTSNTQKNLKIGWVGDWGGEYPMENGVLDVCEDAMRVLEGLGHEVEEMTPTFASEAQWEAWILLRSWTIAGKFAPLLNHPENMVKPELRWEIERGLAVSAADVQKASTIRSDWYRYTADMDVDVFALPSAQVFAFDADLHWPDTIGATRMDTYHRWMEVVVPASLTGLPAVSVPAGFGIVGTPMGLQLIGHRGRDAEILNLGRAYEAATDWVSQRPSI